MKLHDYLRRRLSEGGRLRRAFHFERGAVFVIEDQHDYVGNRIPDIRITVSEDGEVAELIKAV